MSSSFIHGIQGCLSNEKVAGFSHCAPPQEGASDLPRSGNFLLAHCLMTTWWHWQLALQLAFFQEQGRYGSWWLVNSILALCAQAYVQTLLAVLLLESPASSEQRLDLKGLSLSPSQLLERLCSKQLSDRKTFVFLWNVKEGSWFLKFMNYGEWNVPSLSTGEKQRGCVFMTLKLWVISGGRI